MLWTIKNLLRKLSLYGIDVTWFKNYLSGHTQKVKVDRSEGEPIFSSSLPNDIGVFQGGSLSCLLYSIYANDMSLHVHDVEVTQFADDTQLLISGPKRNITQMIQVLERALNDLYDWFCDNRLKVNEKKTQMIVFGTKAMLKNFPAVTINFRGTIIQESRTVKNLGLYMDRYLNFTDHVSRLVSKCTGTLIALIHIKHTLPRSAIRPIVNALVMSSVRYCLAIYGTCTSTEKHRVQKIINFAARVISGKKKFEHISDVMREFNWLSVTQLVDYHRSQLVHKVVKTGMPETLHACLVTGESHNHDTRYSSLMSLPRIRTETGRRQLAYSGVQIYNSIIQRMRENTFKATLLKSLRGEYG